MRVKTGTIKAGEEKNDLEVAIRCKVVNYHASRKESDEIQRSQGGSGGRVDFSTRCTCN